MAEKITKSFIEDAVKEKILEDFTVGPGSKAGDNVAGTLLSIKAIGESGKEYNLVYKYLSGDYATTAWAKDLGIFKTEMNAYVHLVPRLAKFIEKHSGVAYDSITPKYYDGVCTPEEDYLLLEDVRPSGYIMQDKFLGLNFQEVSLILKKIAEFHASSYFYIKEEGERHLREDENMKGFFSNPFTTGNPEMEKMGRLMFTGCYFHALELIRKNDAKLAEKLAATMTNEQEVYNIFHALTHGTDKKYFPCLIHGDFWNNNIMIKYEDEDRTKPVDIKFLDFQMTRRGDIFQELTYFLLCSTTPKFRKEYYDQILRIYYDTFAGFLQDTLKTHLPYGFTRGYFINTMYELLLPGFVHMSFAIPMQLADPIDFGTMVGEASAALGISLAPPPPPPTSQDNNNKDDQASPPGMDISVIMKLKNYMIYQKLKESPRGIERTIQLAQELADLKLI